MAGYTIKDRLINTTAIAVGASETDTVLTSEFKISHEDSMALLVRLDTSAVTVTNAITAKLQSSFNGGTTWVDSNTVSITGNDSYQIEINAYQGTPDVILWTLARVVITSGVSDAATVDNVYVTTRL